jgi:hypothetical protein
MYKSIYTGYGWTKTIMKKRINLKKMIKKVILLNMRLNGIDEFYWRLFIYLK